MKIIEALKKIKHLDRKIEKTQSRIDKWCSYIKEEEGEEPVYNTEDIRKMQQQISDWLKEKAYLRHRLHITNLQTTERYDHKNYTIDELLGLKEIVIPTEIHSLKLMRRKEKRGLYGEDLKNAKVVNQFDSKERDKEIDKLENKMNELDTILDKLTLETDIIM